ncbi:YibL family ribosome-associated protein [Dasania marina]|uniref:YibL family ribosome-associated protein n=1 Tax=Dasania marina TaxID=471499 RepID=UPI0003728F54|nr:YibL family ribosome-associated protein [Dasania marina]
MNTNKELQQLNNRLDKCCRKLTAAKKRGDKEIIMQAQAEQEKLRKAVAVLKNQQGKEVSEKTEAIKSLPFNRELSKQEQADMGKLKKTVRGLVVVHPLTAAGRELGLSQVTGFAPKPF